MKKTLQLFCGVFLLLYICKRKLKTIIMTKNYVIGGKVFKTKGKVREFFQNILQRGEHTLNKKDEGILLDLLTHHPDYEEKVGVGVSNIKVEFHRDFHTKAKAKYPHFHLYREDGSNIDFSYLTCMKGLKKGGGKEIKCTKLPDFKKVMRFEVRDQVLKFRKEAFKKKKYIKCPILGINCSNKTSHIDHAPPTTFDKLLSDFIQSYEVDYRNVDYLEVNGYFDALKDRNLAKLWKSYHRDHAELRVTHRAGNLSQGREKYEFELV